MDIFRQSLGMVLVFALMWTALSFLRKKGWARMPAWTRIRTVRTAPALLESHGKLALTARHSVHLIRIGDRNLILALHPEGVTLLGDARPAVNGEQREVADS